jgi:putative flippase GtrA
LNGTFRVWLKFNTVGLIGIGVQLFVLALLKSGLGMNYLLATTIAVEIAVIHNFIWHERWTWSGGPGRKQHDLTLKVSSAGSFDSI